MKKLFAIFYSVLSFQFAQYSIDDYELIKTTSNRSFNKIIIDEYFRINTPAKINAALLSISHSEDTSFFNEIAKIDFEKHSEYVCFAIGQLGECFNSTLFLKTKLIESKNENIKKICIETIGKTGSKADLDYFISLYLNSNGKYFGIAKMIANFSFRKIKNENSFSVLNEELNSNSDERKIDAAYSLYRLGGSSTSKNILETLLKLEAKSNFKNEILTQYILQCLRRIKYFPNDFELLKKLISTSNWMIRCEASRACVHYNFKNISEINHYLKLLNDKNPNVSRQAAISIKEIKIDSSLSNYCNERISKNILDHKLYANTKGELAVSYYKLFPPQNRNFVKSLLGKIKDNFIYQIAGDNYKLIDYPFGFLLRQFKLADVKNKANLLSCFLKMELDFDSLSLYNDFLIDQFKSNEPEIISVFIENLSDRFIKKHQTKIKEIVVNHINDKFYQPNFGEILISFISFAAKIDSTFENKVLELLSQSKIYSIKKIVYKRLNIFNSIFIKQDFNFDELWNYSFKYRSAIIKTKKGNFEIEFLPQAAPISVGNFCSLAEKNTFTFNPFHRVVPGFVIQGGDPMLTGFGGPGYEIVSEFSPLTYTEGIVGMASNGKDTEGSQWFVTTASYPHLDGRYSIFGKVKKGMDVVSKIDQDDEIFKVTLLP